MCVYLLAILPSAVRVEPLRTGAFAFKPVDRPIAGLDARERAYWATGAMCDCSSPLTTRVRGRSDAALSRRARAFQKKGWNERKIARWLSEQRRIAAADAEHVAKPGEDPSLSDWLSLLHTALAASEPFGLLAARAWSEPDGPDAIERRVRVPLHEFERALPIHEGCLLEIVRGESSP